MPLKDFKQKSDMIRFPLWRANMKNRWRMTGDSGSSPHGFSPCYKGPFGSRYIEGRRNAEKECQGQVPNTKDSKAKRRIRWKAGQRSKVLESQKRNQEVAKTGSGPLLVKGPRNLGQKDAGKAKEMVTTGIKVW